MSTPRAPLLALAIALVAVSLVGPGTASAGDDGVVGTTTLTATLSTPTLTATPTVDTSVTETEVVGTLENTTDDVADSTNDSIDDAEDTVDDTIEVIGGDTLLDSSLSADTVLSADGAVDAVDNDSPTPTPEPESPTSTAASDGGSSTETTASVGAVGIPIDKPSDPLVGGVVLGGVAALGGLAGRELLVNGDVSRGPFRTASAAALDAVTGWRDRLGPLLGLFGYQRYDDSSPLDHEGRRQLAEAVRADPGVHLSGLSGATELPLSTARYHLRILEHEGLVRAVKLHGKRRYFPPDVEGEALVASLTDEATASVLRSLVDAGPASVSELAERLDRDPSTISHHLDRLADKGLVERERAGRAVVSSATSEVEAAVDRLRSDEPVAVTRPAATD